MRARRLHASSLGSGAELPRNELIAALTPAEARALLYEWAFWARPNQLPPDGDWRVWLASRGPWLWQDANGRRNDPRSGHCANRTSTCARSADSRRCARCHGRRRKRHPGDLATLGAAAVRAVEAASDLAERGRCHTIQRRRTRTPSRTAARRSVVRRACQLALSGGLGHADVRPALRN